ncbi:MAG: GTP cyclohydrolase I [Acidobacteriota bacterium]|nr:MAG: GTP cyclohydrolase I [Acidobacteriota bacterium]
MSRRAMEQSLRAFLAELLAERPPDPGLDREELLSETPRRVLEALLDDLLAGAGQPIHPLKPIQLAAATGPVLLDGIRFTAVCAHHLLPFRGEAHIGFVPSGYHVGLGDLARLVDQLARRLTLQETLAAAMADQIETSLAPRSLLVLVEAEHLCLADRGARKKGHRFRTLERRGVSHELLERLLARA